MFNFSGIFAKYHDNGKSLEIALFLVIFRGVPNHVGARYEMFCSIKINFKKAGLLRTLHVHFHTQHFRRSW